MARTMRSHKGTFYVKARSTLKIQTTGVYTPMWAKLLPANMIVSKYWVRFRMHQHDDVSTDLLQPLEYSVDGYMLNIPPTSDLMATAGGGSSVAHIDSSDSLTTTLKQLGTFPGVDSPYQPVSNTSDVNIRQGVKPHRFYQDRQFFERSKTLTFPTNSIMVNSDSYRFYDAFHTDGTRLGQNTDYKAPRVITFFTSIDNTHIDFNTNNSQMLTGATASGTDVDIAEWNRQSQTVFDPTYHQDITSAGNNIDLDTLGNLGEGSTGDDASLGNAGNLYAFADDSSTYWDPMMWLKSGYSDSDDDVDTYQTNTYMLIDLDVTLQCQMYNPSSRSVVTVA